MADRPAPEPSPPPTPRGPRLWRASVYSYAGLRDAWRHEAAARLEVVLVVVFVPVALWLPVPVAERVILACSLLAVLAIELVNTAIERVVDRVSTDRHPLSGRAKDLGSAAVGVTSLATLIAWVAIAGPVLWTWLSGR